MIAIGKNRQAEIYLNGFQGKKPLISVLHSNLEEKAKRKLSRNAFGYLSCGAGTNQGIVNNIATFDKFSILPNMLCGVETPELKSEILNTKLSFPFLFAPIGVLGLAHPKGDVELAKASRLTCVPMIQSNQASFCMENCAAELGDTDRWFQLYFSKSKALVESFVNRAEATNCKAIVVTLDTTSLGWRSIDLNNAFLPFLQGLGIAQYTSDPVFNKLMNETEIRKSNISIRPQTIINLYTLFKSYPDSFINNIKTKNPIRAVQTFLNIFSRPELSWEDIMWLKKISKIPILLKGILHPEDARKALGLGIDGIIVSNHGGRQIDRVSSSLDALIEIKKAIPENYPLLLDSGIRSGADIFISIALGAKAVCLGRPYVYALAIGGKDAVVEYVQNMASELQIIMSLSGCKSITDINKGHLAI